MRKPGLGGLGGEGRAPRSSHFRFGPFELSRHLRRKLSSLRLSVFGVVAGERSRRGLRRTVTPRVEVCEPGEWGERRARGAQSVLVALSRRRRVSGADRPRWLRDRGGGVSLGAAGRSGEKQACGASRPWFPGVVKEEARESRSWPEAPALSSEFGVAALGQSQPDPGSSER